MPDSWDNAVEQLTALLTCVEIDRSGAAMSADQGFEYWAELVREVRRTHNTVYIIGNGASASMASHFSADMAKNGHMSTQVFTDNALISAISNDMGYEWVFAEPLRRRGNKGDMLICISSSGQSPNILKAAETAKELGIQVVTLSGFCNTNTLRQCGDLNIYVNASSYGNAESCHAVIMHHVVNLLVE